MIPPSRLALTLAAALALAGAAGAMPAPDYVRQINAGDLYEVKASQILLASSRNGRLRNLARLMIADHRKMDGAVNAAALQSGVTLTRPALTPYQAALLADLRATRGVDRDQLYLAQQKGVHRSALAAHQDYAATGDLPDLRTAAARTVPLIRQHLAALDAMPM